MSKDFIIENISGRNICIRGIGKMFYQDGFPISMSLSYLMGKGVEVSMLHVADECLKNGWSPKTTISKLREDFADGADGDIVDMPTIEKFCNSGYDEQREMIFEYLFGNDENAAKDFFKTKIAPSNK